MQYVARWTRELIGKFFVMPKFSPLLPKDLPLTAKRSLSFGQSPSQNAHLDLFEINIGKTIVSFYPKLFKIIITVNFQNPSLRSNSSNSTKISLKNILIRYYLSKQDFNFNFDKNHFSFAKLQFSFSKLQFSLTLIITPL